MANLIYISVLGSAASYGVFFYNASKGNLTALSSLTFLTPMFAAGAGYLALGETLTPIQVRTALPYTLAGCSGCSSCCRSPDLVKKTHMILFRLFLTPFHTPSVKAIDFANSLRREFTQPMWLSVCRLI